MKFITKDTLSTIKVPDDEFIKTEDKSMFYVIDYYTDEIITCVDNFELAKKLCNMYDGLQVVTENNSVLYMNIDLPF